MKRLVLLCFSLLLLMGYYPIQAEAAEDRAVFVRKDGLWLKDGGLERRIVEGSKLSHPKFSNDGVYVSYLSGDAKELWVYNRVTRLKRKIFAGDAIMPRWSPVSSLLAWKSGSVLNVIDVSRPASSFQNVTLGVGNYSWTVDGKGFVVSSSANLEPDGWSQVRIFSVPSDANGDLKKVKKITTLPEMNESFFAIGTTEFKWGMDGRLFAFIACPTASMSADSNTLMVVSKNGSKTKMIANMLSNSNWFQWSPKSEKLGYISGIGRLTSENKRLTFWDAKSGKERNLGFEGYADGDFTWNSDKKIIVSRQIEWGWDVPEEKRSRPFLAEVNAGDGSAKRITNPPIGAADVYPKTLSDDGFVWVRTYLNSNAKVLKKTDTAAKESVWIDNLIMPEDCYGWHCVLDVYKAR